VGPATWGPLHQTFLSPDQRRQNVHVYLDPH
jgi:hypothetical protein